MRWIFKDGEIMAKGQKQQKGGRNKQLPARLTEKELEKLRIAKKEMSYSDFIMFLYDFWVMNKWVE